MEMTLKNLTDGDKIDHQDFLDRADILGALGKTVLISNYAEYHRLASYLFRHTKKMIGIVMGVPTLREISTRNITPTWKGNSRVVRADVQDDLKLYAYPLLDQPTGSLITAGTSGWRRTCGILRYLVENRSSKASAITMAGV